MSAGSGAAAAAGGSRSRSSTAAAAASAAVAGASSFSTSASPLTRTESFAKRLVTERGIEVRLPINYGSFDVNQPLLGADFNENSRESRPKTRRHTVGNDEERDMREAEEEEAEEEAANRQQLARASAAVSRYKYYNRVAPKLTMPTHVVPSQFLLVLPIKVTARQSSIVTIFSIWNTMMGTSLLSMPWAIKEAGFATSWIVMLVMTAVTFYTAYLVLKTYTELSRSHLGTITEFSDVCRHFLGSPGEIVSIAFSAIALLGAVIVYWVLLSNFLYQTGRFVHGRVFNETLGDSSQDVFYYKNESYRVLCPNFPLPEPVPTAAPAAQSESFFADDNNANRTRSTFDSLWNQTDTVPFYLILLLLPLISIKSPEFFSKFNALGTVAVVYILTFVGVKAVSWGFHLDFEATNVMEVVHQFRPTFPLITGVLSLAMFCHNAIVALTRNQRKPENNNRDLFIAYVCVSLTYMIVGFVFYAVYPLAKDCIEQNFLDNIPNADILAFTARIFLFVQMLTVFPLLMYILRAQVFYYLYKNVYPSRLHAFVLHVVVLGAAVSVAHFYPKIGSIIRYSGSLCGLAYIFTLPPVIHLLSERANNRLTWTKICLHSVIVLAGVLNFVSQFLFIGK